MKIRDMHSSIAGDETRYIMPSGGLEIITEEGSTLFCISTCEGGGIEISTGGFCKHQGKVYDTSIGIKPVASNVIKIFRDEYR